MYANRNPDRQNDRSNRRLAIIRPPHPPHRPPSPSTRLDIDDELAKRAHDLGIPLLVNADAHSVRELDFMAFGVRQARCGWQSSAMVANAWDLGAVIRRLAR
jgi:hypothetical protein